MKISYVSTIFVGIVSLFSFKDALVSADVTSHGARPGNTRKSPKKIMEAHKQNGKGLIHAYFGSWNNYTQSINTNGSKVDVLYIAFARFAATYDGNLDSLGTAEAMRSITGIEYASAQALMSELKTLRTSNPDIIIMLSLGGETYHPASHSEGLERIPNIVKIVDDLGFDGVDLDYEPRGSFDALNEDAEANFFIEYAKKLRATMCEDKLISISVSSNGAIPCSHMPGNNLCADDTNPYGPAYMSGQSGAPHPDIVTAASYRSSGTSITIINTLKDIIDIIFVQTYNLTNTQDPLVIIELYKSFLHYAEKYNISVAMGFTVLFPDNPFKAGDQNLISKIGEAIKSKNQSSKRADGLGVWGFGNPSQYISDSEYLALWRGAL